jgi:hypothetical protein
LIWCLDNDETVTSKSTNEEVPDNDVEKKALKTNDQESSKAQSNPQEDTQLAVEKLERDETTSDLGSTVVIDSETKTDEAVSSAVSQAVDVEVGQKTEDSKLFRKN